VSGIEKRPLRTSARNCRAAGSGAVPRLQEDLHLVERRGRTIPYEEGLQLTKNLKPILAVRIGGFETYTWEMLA
jgi:hypothetical protein